MDKKNDIKETLKEKNPEILSLEEFFGEDFQKEADFIGENWRYLRNWCRKH